MTLYLSYYLLDYVITKSISIVLVLLKLPEAQPRTPEGSTQDPDQHPSQQG
jgi:hypothetical protein